MKKTIRTRDTIQGYAEERAMIHLNSRENVLNGVYLARVVQNSDEQYNGRFNVELIDDGSPSNDPGTSPEDLIGIKTILPTSPFGGTTSSKTATDNKQYATSQNSYGMAPQAPPIGATVLVAFIQQQKEGFMIGSIFDKDRNYSIPGLAHAEVDKKSPPTKAPASELNPNTKDFNEGVQAPHPMMANIVEAGLAGDFIRGLSSSGMRRDTINNAFGFTTASGHSITMDDGGSAGTDRSIRIRTANGAQILLHDEAEIIYIQGANGAGYIEIDRAGAIDIYSRSTLSVNAEEGINFKTDGSFNLEAGAINMKSMQSGIKMESATGKIEMHSATDVTISADANGNLNFGGNLRATASRIDWNGPTADKAEKPTPGALARNTGVKESIAGRVPEHEPWGGRDTFAGQSAGGMQTI
tara:strand:+ start:5837 stop:7072 length:1236 start_codon:yes stop_codon:yes gene_type:complete